VIWSSTATIERVLVRRIKEELGGLSDDIVDIRQRAQAARDELEAEIVDIRQLLQTARNTVQQLVAEVAAARGGFPSLSARLSDGEARIATLEAAAVPPVTPEVLEP